MEIYPEYRNLNTLISDLLRGKAKYNKKTNILTFPNEESIKIT